jgi:hypothetical protein
MLTAPDPKEFQMVFTATGWITVNGVKVRLVAECDTDGGEYVRLEAENGDLEGEQPGVYYPLPLGSLA